MGSAALSLSVCQRRWPALLPNGCDCAARVRSLSAPTPTSRSWTSAPPRLSSPAELRYRHRQSPFVGRELAARVRWTILRGEPVYRDGRLLGAPRGRLVTPAVPGWWP